MGRLRSHLHSAMVDSGKSMRQLAAELGMSPQQASDAFSGRAELGVVTLLRLSELVGKPVWWFFDEPPQGISLEAAEVALQNVGRIRLYLDALESEFRQVTGRQVAGPVGLDSVERLAPAGGGGAVVDMAPYLARARAILEREVESVEENGDVSEESVEMVAQGLLSAETGLPLSRWYTSSSSEDCLQPPL